MESSTGFRCGKPRGGLPPGTREKFWQEIAAGFSPTMAGTRAGVSGATGRRWTQQAGHVAEPASKKRYPAASREAFWAGLQAGKSTAQAAAEAGVSENAARRWVDKTGFVLRTVSPDLSDASGTSTARGRGPLTFRERCWLEDALEDGCNQADAARRVGCSAATVSREISRGRSDSGYRARLGQQTADAGRPRPKPRKLDTCTRLRGEVLERLKRRHSPEQIAGRLREDFPDAPEMQVSHETIYQAMYAQPRGRLAKEVSDALRTGRVRRKRHGRQPSAGRDRFAGMINISERPAEADDRAVPGHWEGDLIVGAHSASAIGTLVERTTGFVLLLHLPCDHTAASVADAMTAKIPEIPEILRRSLTWDQGSELALHTEITEATGMPIYFCDPHSPWQRGSNENTNGLLRQYFPKGTDLSVHGPGILDNVAAELNARPRKRHHWRTPAEELERLLSDPQTFVATTA